VPLEHFHKSCSAAESDLKAAVFSVFGFVSAQFVSPSPAIQMPAGSLCACAQCSQGFQTCAFAKASPITKNPRSASLHHFSQCSNEGRQREKPSVYAGGCGLIQTRIWDSLGSRFALGFLGQRGRGEEALHGLFKADAFQLCQG